MAEVLPKWNLEGKILCSICLKRPAKYKKVVQCHTCYHKDYVASWQKNNPRYGKVKKKWGVIDLPGPHMTKNGLIIEHGSEITFARLFPNFIYWPANFKVRGDSKNYSPDFYDPEGNVFYEVIGTFQAYHANKGKIEEFRKIFPKIILKLVMADGSEFIPGEPSKYTFERKIKKVHPS